MKKVLVAYFSATGTTKKIAVSLAEAEGADLFEIVPAKPYTAEDLNWQNKQSRSTVEMQDLTCRPEVAVKADNMDQYDVVFVGFPIWWGREPSIVDTFLEAYDFSGKTIVPFCTSGGNGIGFIGDRMKELVGRDVTVVNGQRMGGEVSVKDLKTWADGLEL